MHALARRALPPRPLARAARRLVGCAVGAGVLGAGCTCRGDRAYAPGPAATSAGAASTAAAGPACAPPPFWAEGTADLRSLVAELLYLPAIASGRKGTGYRLYEDGRFDTFDEIDVRVDDAGKIVSRPVPPEWRTRGGVPPARVDAVRAVVEEAATGKLEGWIGPVPEGPFKIEWTAITLRRGGRLLRACYLGSTGPAHLDAIETALRDLVPVARK